MRTFEPAGKHASYLRLAAAAAAPAAPPAAAPITVERVSPPSTCPITAPAMALETAAKSGRMEHVARLLAEVREMAQRVVAPDEASAAT